MEATMAAQTQSDQICCPEFDPAPWDDKIFEWTDKKFIKDSVFTLFYMPMNFGKVMKRLDENVRKAGAEITDCLSLSDHTSKWNMDVYLAVDKEVPGAENTTLSGKFYSKVYEGSFSDTGKWCKDLEGIAKTKGYTIKKLFMWYTTCPKCAKKYGKNYVAIVTEII
jgi:hypothetical protein